MKLQAPDSYWKLTDEQKDKLLNQCGPDGPLNKVIPDHLLGLSISESCNIHDYMFGEAIGQQEAKLADKVFLRNMKTQVESKNDRFLTTMRRFLAYLYYVAVRGYSKLNK
jgi:hypothetical protein